MIYRAAPRLFWLITAGVAAMMDAIISYRPITDDHGEALFTGLSGEQLALSLPAHPPVASCWATQREINYVQSARRSANSWSVSAIPLLPVISVRCLQYLKLCQIGLVTISLPSRPAPRGAGIQSLIVSVCVCRRERERERKRLRFGDVLSASIIQHVSATVAHVRLPGGECGEGAREEDG